jgi:hypothetical protein
MVPTIEVDPNLLFKKIKNQFLAAIIGIIILVIFAITLIINGAKELCSLHIYGVGALIIVAIISCSIVLKLNSAVEESKKISESRIQNVAEASHNLWRLIVGLGEVCLESDIPDKKRIFVSDALSQVIENELEQLGDKNCELREILLGIKKSSDSEIHQNRTFSMALSQQKEI